MRPDETYMDMGEWLGFPYDPQYKERESTYLACEIQVVAEIIEYLESRENDPGENVVVDTTGSAIYTGEEILTRLRRSATIVLLSTPPEVQDLMLKTYTANHRPVLWRDMFSKEPNETNEEALARSYPKLLVTREHLYERYADATIDYYTRNQDGFGVSDFLDRINVRTM
jgi:shikimate kinase